MTFKLPKPQKLRQGSERDCSVPVFAALAGVSEDQVRRDLPRSHSGQVSVLEWMTWLEKKGLPVLKRDGCPSDIVPCAHLVASHPPRDHTDFHWIYRDADGDVHDPSPVFEAMPADDPRMRDLSLYTQQVLTISVSNPLTRQPGPTRPRGETHSPSLSVAPSSHSFHGPQRVVGPSPGVHPCPALGIISVKGIFKGAINAVITPTIGALRPEKNS
jgi:hypothetical protein